MMKKNCLVHKIVASISAQVSDNVLAQASSLGLSKAKYIRTLLRAIGANRIEIPEKYIKTSTERIAGKKAWASIRLSDDDVKVLSDISGKYNLSYAACLRLICLLSCEVEISYIINTSLPADIAIRIFNPSDLKGLRESVNEIRSELVRWGVHYNQLVHALNIIKQSNWLPEDHMEAHMRRVHNDLRQIDEGLDALTLKAAEHLSLLYQMKAQGFVVWEKGCD